MLNYLNYYEIQHTDANFEDLIHYLQDAVKEGNLQITKEVVDNIIEIAKNKELDRDNKERYYDEGYEDGEREGKADGYADGYDEGYLDGYEKGKEEIQNPDLEQIKQKIADEKYREGYFIGYDHARRKWEPKFDNQKNITPDDLPF